MSCMRPIDSWPGKGDDAILAAYLATQPMTERDESEHASRSAAYLALPDILDARKASGWGLAGGPHFHIHRGVEIMSLLFVKTQEAANG